MSTDSALGKGLNVMTLGLYRPVMKALFPGQKSASPDINTDPGQTSTYGAFITRTHGTIGQSGNIIWLEGNKLRAVVKKAKKSGKGGATPAATATVTYFATFAVGLCEGPIAGVRRIWIGPDLIYDAGSDDLETIISSNLASSSFTLYLGTDTQQPDPRIQADCGTANAPAYRGLAYIVMKDLALANYGNSVAGAQVKVEIANAATISTDLVRSVNSAYSSPYTDTSFPVRPYFVSQEKVCVYVPQWNGAYPSSSSFIKYQVLTSSELPAIVIPVTGGTGVPPNGDSDDENEYWKSKSAVFSGGGNFSGPNGYIQARGGIYAGISISSGRKLFIGEKGSLPSSLFVGTSADCFAISTESIYAISSNNITEYSIAGDILSTVSVTVPALSYPEARADFYDGELYIFDGINTIYKASSDLSLLSFYAQIPTIADANYYSVSVSMSDSMVVQSYGITNAKRIIVKWYSLFSLSENSVPLSSIVATESARSSLIKPADIDTAGLSGSVIGYRVTSGGSIRDALEPLRAAYPFDAFQAGYKIKFRSRGTASVVTIPIGNLAADTQLEESREMDSQLPSRMTVQYLDRNRDYDQNEQEDARLGADGDTQEVSIQVVMTGAQARQVAEKQLALAWLERTPYSFKLPPIYGRIEAADTITIVAEYATYELRLNSVNPDSDGMLSCSGVPSNASLYTSSTPADEGQQPPVTIPLKGATFGALIDCPVIDETLQNSPGFIVGLNGYASGWPGGTLFRSTDSGQTWADIQAFTGRAMIGFASTVLGAHSGSLIQRGGSLVVSASDLESVTEAQMLGGSNIAAYGAPGRWEVIRFQNAALNGDGTYTLDTFWRGDKGTEWATGLHVAGDAFVLLTDPDLAFVGMATESIGLPRDYRMVTFDADIDSSTSQSFAYAGANLECLSPVYARGVRLSGDLAVTWTRRSRLSSSWWTNGVVAPVGETTEAYEVDVMSGSTVKRTISSVAPAITYTSAQQVEDFGSAQASITMRIYQLSTAVGRGLPLEVTL